MPCLVPTATEISPEMLEFWHLEDIPRLWHRKEPPPRAEGIHGGACSLASDFALPDSWKVRAHPGKFRAPARPCPQTVMAPDARFL